jgi:hypothetical protein
MDEWINPLMSSISYLKAGLVGKVSHWGLYLGLLFLAVLASELRALNLLGRHSTT